MGWEFESPPCHSINHMRRLEIDAFFMDGVLWGCADFVLTCGQLAQFLRFGHDALERLRIGLLIHLEQCGRVLPAAGESHVT